jgi:hypothetical protein
MRLRGVFENLDVKTPSPMTIAKKHNVSLGRVHKELNKGIKVELEHTTDKAVAQEIALDHLGEFVDYYDRLKKAEQ